MQITKNGEEIRTIDEWKNLAPPKLGDKQWKAGRSALECARAWCGGANPCVPDEIMNLLNSLSDTQGCVIETVIPEHQVRFDKLRGEPRNADVVCEATHPNGRIAISIEAKADETFDLPVRKVLEHAVHKIANDENTHAITRVQQLAASLLPPHVADTAHLGELHYQLLTAVAGAIAYAEQIKAERAVFVVHEFITTETVDKKHNENAEALNKFVKRVTSGQFTHVDAGQLIGPILIPGKPLFDAPPLLYIGKAQRNVRQ